MILSVSRRTDIPAFYSDWFFNRLKEGYVLVRNPMNYHQVSKILLSPTVIDCIVFWTKNPTIISDKLDLLKDYKYYFQVTINPYNKEIEQNVPSKNIIIDSFIKLSKRIGKEKTIWRYDPIIITDTIDFNYHYKYFNYICKKLEGCTDSCIISFVDIYKKTERNMEQINYSLATEETMLEIAKKFADIAMSYNIKISSCSETIDLSSIGVEHAKCIDDRLISKIVGQEINIPKDKNQRKECGCVESIDIGAYNTCKHGCKYCYANFSETAVSEYYVFIVHLSRLNCALLPLKLCSYSVQIKHAF
ncbi:MAG: DUF1848 domain-containing protein, partial [Sedimentibacter sp.]|uniref:DUF1848 domain-containing protein n=1 Tax=Sedimentibacter sp. TaxID=1960295 RepID=UPI00298235AB